MNKKVLANLEKCYSIAPIHYKNADHILVAAEKTDRCILFDINGNEEETVWEGPGGVMTMVQVPGTDGQFLATHKFYSPNDSKEAKIILAYPEDGEWKAARLGIDRWYSGDYGDLLNDQNVDEEFVKHNVALMEYRSFRANYRAGYWEVILVHTRPLGVVPKDMRVS